MKFAQAAAQAKQAEVERCRQAQASAQQSACEQLAEAKRLAEHCSERSAEPEWASCTSTEEERRLEFGAHLVAQMTAQSQEQQDDLACKVLNAQAESARMQIGRVDNARQEVDDELNRISAVTRQVASSSAEALRASQQATANMGRKVGGVEGRLREQVSGLEQVLEQSIKHHMAQADRIEAWMRPQSEQQVVMLQQSKAFAD